MYDNKNLEVEFHFGRTSGLILKLGIELETVGIKCVCVCMCNIYANWGSTHTPDSVSADCELVSAAAARDSWAQYQSEESF